jgi:hypothetical protein
MAQLKIDGNGIELGRNRLVFSKAGYSFTDWLTRDITYSERITLPETSLLNSIFFRPYSTEITGQKFSKFHTFKYIENGKIVNSGVAKLFRFNENKEYEIQLLDKSFELFDNLNNELTALDLESSDFTFNTTSYNTLKVLNSSVWIWSASSMHQDKTLAKNILSGNLAFSRPFLSVKRLVEAMFAANGWSYNLEVNCDAFDTLIVSPKAEFVFTSFEKSFTTTLTTGNIDLSSPDFINGDTVSPATQLNTTYNSKLRFRGDADADNDFILTITVTGTKPFVQTFIINQGSNDYDLTSNEITGGDAVVISLTGTGNIDLTSFLIYTIIDENDFGTMSSANFAGYKVKTYDNLPEIEQKELFKHCLVSIGGFFTSDNFGKKINIFSVKSLYRLGAIDWSSKYVEDSESVEPLDNYGKVNYYVYDNSDIKPFNLGRGSFQVDNETLPNKINVYESVFAASSEVTITDIMIDNDVYDDTERINDINTLIGYYEVSGVYTVARFEQLNGNSILSNYYSNFVKAVQRGELVEAEFNLNKSDFFLFDFTKLIYLNQKKSTFYVLGINNYTENDKTDVTLLRV